MWLFDAVRFLSKTELVNTAKIFAVSILPTLTASSTFGYAKFDMFFFLNANPCRGKHHNQIKNGEFAFENSTIFSNEF